MHYLSLSKHSKQVSEGDGLPSQVCLQCVHYINRAFSFKQLCERSDSTLRQLLGSTIDSTFLELKPVSQNEFIVSDISEVQGNITNEISNVIQFAKDELGGSNDAIDSLFREYQLKLFAVLSLFLKFCLVRLLFLLVVVAG